MLRAPRSCTYSYTAWTACDATGTQTRTVTSATPAKCTGTPVTMQDCTPTDPTLTANPCWTPPPDFYTALQVQVAAQPPYMTGYGGQIANPFPDLGTTHFDTIQIARATAKLLKQAGVSRLKLISLIVRGMMGLAVSQLLCSMGMPQSLRNV